MSVHTPAPTRLVHASSRSSASPLISIIIPTYCRDTMLAEALTSALLQDTAEPIEIIVVDNDPLSTAAVLTQVPHEKTRHQLKYYVNETNLGMTGNWNQGIALARGRWVSMLHDDDWLAPQFISTMLPLMQSGAEFAACNVKTGNQDFNPKILHRSRDSNRVSAITLDDLVYGNPSPAPGLLISREKLIKINGFDHENYPCADYATYIQCARNGKSSRINRTLAYYRTTDSETFKGNTLQLMIEKSDKIKRELLRDLGTLSSITYIISMAYWFRIAREHNADISIIKLDRHLKAAKKLSYSPLIYKLATATRIVFTRALKSRR